MNIRVSTIKSRALRRAVIAGAYPFAAVCQVLLSAWNAVVDIIGDQLSLAISAGREWRK